VRRLCATRMRIFRMCELCGYPFARPSDSRPSTDRLRSASRCVTSRMRTTCLLSEGIRAVTAWYWSRRGVSPLPFYCDPKVVGAFAVSPDDLSAGKEAAIYRLLVTLSMYQALRDVVIMRQQCATPPASAALVADLEVVRRSTEQHPCSALSSAQVFDVTCDVTKVSGLVDCGTHTGTRCHVKDATAVFNRMGDMGKLPTSAWLNLFRGQGIRTILAHVCDEVSSPTERAALLVSRFTQVHRVGRKVATMFISALSTPALAPGYTPWFPDIDGNDLVVVDTNVARAVDALREPGAARTYDARERWVRGQAAQMDLRRVRTDLPSYSPRLVQEALYAFCSRSNRVAQGDVCAKRAVPCPGCVPELCPLLSRAIRLAPAES
jgi:hypothetical protein